VFEKKKKHTQGGKSSDYREFIVLKKAPFSKCFLSTLKRKAGVFKFPMFEERFQLRFRDGLVRAVGLTAEVKLRFQISPA